MAIDSFVRGVPVNAASLLSAPVRTNLDGLWESWHAGQCRLEKSGSNLLLKPWNGREVPVKISTTWERKLLPTAGITLAATGLSVGTTYFIYLFWTGSALALEASTTGHAVDTTTGLEVKSTDALRLLVGMARVITGPAWQDAANQRFVLSWYNRRAIAVKSVYSSNRSTTSTTFAEPNTEIRAEFLTWAEEAVWMQSNGIWESSLDVAVITASLGLDSATVAKDTFFQLQYTVTGEGGQDNGFSLSLAEAMAEGYHFVTLLGKTSAGTVTFTGAGSEGTERCAVRAMIQG